MFLAEICVKRPVFTTMLIMALVVIGWFSYDRLGLDLLPKIDRPVVGITTRLPGASPEEMETQVTKLVEEAVNTINGLEELRSSTSEGYSRVVTTFALERDADAVTQDVRDKISTILAKFPKDTDPPIVEKFDPDSAPILAIVVSARRDQREITESVDKRIKQPLETITGVGSITLVGDRKREIQVTLDPRKLAAYGVSIEQAKQAIDRFKKEDREIGTLSLSVSEDLMARIKDKVKHLRREILEMARLDETAERVYQINFQIFPLSKKYSHGGGP
jgi:HAE1 family hydrophobic/amphiphilic exporter-1